MFSATLRKSSQAVYRQSTRTFSQSNKFFNALKQFSNNTTPQFTLATAGGKAMKVPSNFVFNNDNITYSKIMGTKDDTNVDKREKDMYEATKKATIEINKKDEANIADRINKGELGSRDVAAKQAQQAGNHTGKRGFATNNKSDSDQILKEAEKAGKQMKEGVQDLKENVNRKYEEWTQSSTGINSKPQSWADQIKETAAKKGSDWAKQAQETAEDVTPKAKKAANEFVKEAKDKVNEATGGKTMSQAASDVAKGAKDAANYAKDKVNEATGGKTVSQAASDVAKGAKDAANYAKDKVNEVTGNTTADKVKDWASSAKETVEGAAQTVKDKVNEAAGNTWTQQAKDAASTIADKAKQLLTKQVLQLKLLKDGLRQQRKLPPLWLIRQRI